MAKRYTDTTIWKKQRWFKKLDPIHKLAWKYITDTCDHAGILKIDFGELIDDLGLEEFDISAFIEACNTEFDKSNGKKIHRERLKLIKKNTLWITGFIKFQYESKDFLVNPSIPAVFSALRILNSYEILEEGLNKGYFTLSQDYNKSKLRTKDKDKDKDKDKVMDIIEDEEGGMGEEEEDFKEQTKFIVPEMLEVYKKNNKDYGEDISRDYPQLQSIAQYIFNYFKMPGDFLSNHQKILDEWDVICQWIVKDSFWRQKSLKSISTHIQEMVNKSTNGTAKKQTTSGIATTAGKKHQSGLDALLARGQQKYASAGGGNSSS